MNNTPARLTRIPDLDLPLTQRHIDQAVRRHARLCPISLALKDVYPHAWIDRFRCTVSNAPSDVRGLYLDHTPAVTAWIDRYDDHGPQAIQPATLHIRNQPKPDGPPALRPVLSITIPAPAASNTASPRPEPALAAAARPSPTPKSK